VYPPASSIKAFQGLLYEKTFDEMLPSYNMTPEAMAKPCVTGWVSSGMLLKPGTGNREPGTTGSGERGTEVWERAVSSILH